MTERETDLLEMFRMLGKYEQNIIIGKISELILNKKKESLIFLRKMRLGICLLFLYLFFDFFSYKEQKTSNRTITMRITD
ncbi:MAG: hypothetical protein AB7V48_00830 [Sedimentibacter sp.]